MPASSIKSLHSPESEEGGDQHSINDYYNLTAHAQMVNNMYISLLYQHATHNVLFIHKVRLRSLESANNAKTYMYEVSKSAKSTQYMCLEHHKEPYDTALVDS